MQPRVAVRRVAEELLRAVEVVVNLLAALGCMLQHVAEVHDAEADVARLVLGAEAEDGLLGLVLGDELAGAEHRLDETLGQHMHQRGHLGEVLGVEDVAQATRRALRLEEATAVDERALAEHIEVARLVHHLRDEVERDFIVVRADLLQPLAGRVASDELDLCKEGADLADRFLYDVRKRLHRLPGDVRRGAPLALDGLLVDQRGVIGPDVALFGHEISGAHDAGARRGTAHPGGAMSRDVRRLTVDALVDFVQGEAAPPYLRFDYRRIFRTEPAQVEVWHTGFFSQLLDDLLVYCHASPPFQLSFRTVPSATSQPAGLAKTFSPRWRTCGMTLSHMSSMLRSTFLCASPPMRVHAR